MNYSDVAHPLIDLTKKDIPFIWMDTCDAAFSTLKQQFLSTAVLQMPDKDRPFIVAVDASLHTTGGILMQKTLMVTYIPAPTYQLPSPLQNIITRFTIENCLPSSTL